jgi:hypothetical protein
VSFKSATVFTSFSFPASKKKESLPSPASKDVKASQKEKKEKVFIFCYLFQEEECNRFHRLFIQYIKKKERPPSPVSTDESESESSTDESEGEDEKASTVATPSVPATTAQVKSNIHNPSYIQRLLDFMEDKNRYDPQKMSNVCQHY